MPQSEIDSLLVTVQPIEVVWFLFSFTSYWDFSLAGKLRRDNRLRAENGKDGSAKTQGFVNVWLAILNGWAKLLIGSISIPSLFLEPRVDVVSDSRIAAIVATYYVPIAAVTAFSLLCGATFLLYWGYQRVGDQIEAEAHAVTLATEAAESHAVALAEGHAAGQADAAEAARVLGETVATAVDEERAQVVEQALSDAGRDEAAVSGERQRVTDLQASDASAVSEERARVMSEAATHAQGVAAGEASAPPQAEPVSPAEIAEAVTEGIQAVTQKIKADTTAIKADTAEIKAATVKADQEPDP